jgi:hypothetical protein
MFVARHKSGLAHKQFSGFKILATWSRLPEHIKRVAEIALSMTGLGPKKKLVSGNSASDSSQP